MQYSTLRQKSKGKAKSFFAENTKKAERKGGTCSAARKYGFVDYSAISSLMMTMKDSSESQIFCIMSTGQYVLTL